MSQQARKSVFNGRPLDIKSRISRVLCTEKGYSLFTILSTTTLISVILLNYRESFSEGIVRSCTMLNHSVGIISASPQAMRDFMINSSVQTAKEANKDFVILTKLVLNIFKGLTISYVERLYKIPICVAESAEDIVRSGISNFPDSISQFTKKTLETLQSVLGLPFPKRNTSTLHEQNDDVITSAVSDLLQSVIDDYVRSLEKATNSVNKQLDDLLANSKPSEIRVSEYQVCDISNHKEGIARIKEVFSYTIYAGVLLVVFLVITAILALIFTEYMHYSRRLRRIKKYSQALSIVASKGTVVQHEDAHDLMCYAKNPSIWIFSNLVWQRLTGVIRSDLFVSKLRWALMYGIHVPGLIFSFVGIAGLASAGLQLYVLNGGYSIILRSSARLWDEINSNLLTNFPEVDFESLKEFNEKLLEIQKNANTVYKKLASEGIPNLLEAYYYGERLYESTIDAFPQGVGTLFAPIKSTMECIMRSKIALIDKISSALTAEVSFRIDSADMMKTSVAGFEAFVRQEVSTVFAMIMGAEGEEAPIVQGAKKLVQIYKASIKRYAKTSLLIFIYGIYPGLTSVLYICILRPACRVLRKVLLIRRCNRIQRCSPIQGRNSKSCELLGTITGS